MKEFLYVYDFWETAGRTLVKICQMEEALESRGMKVNIKKTKAIKAFGQDSKWSG